MSIATDAGSVSRNPDSSSGYASGYCERDINFGRVPTTNLDRRERGKHRMRASITTAPNSSTIKESPSTNIFQQWLWGWGTAPSMRDGAIGTQLMPSGLPPKGTPQPGGTPNALGSLCRLCPCRDPVGMTVFRVSSNCLPTVFPPGRHRRRLRIRRREPSVFKVSLFSKKFF